MSKNIKIGIERRLPDDDDIDDDIDDVIGIDCNGVIHTFVVDTYEFRMSVYATHKNLVSITIPEGVKIIYCNDNMIKRIIIPLSATHVYCYNNDLKIIKIPNNVKEISCDKSVKGLDKYIDKDILRLY